MDILDFTREHVDEAKKLALCAYNRERSLVKILPAVDDLTGFEEFVENGLGVVALAEGKMVGFLGCHHPRENAFRSRAKGVFSSTHGHGAAGANRGEIYQRMYQAAADKWVKQGIAYHGLALYAHDAEAIRAMFTCGFGLRA